jgi:hypothetical protein
MKAKVPSRKKIEVLLAHNKIGRAARMLLELLDSRRTHDGFSHRRRP